MATGGDGAAAVGLSADDAARRPSPGSSGASSVCFSPGGQSVTFLRASAASLSNELCEMDLKTGVRVKRLLRPWVIVWVHCTWLMR